MGMGWLVAALAALAARQAAAVDCSIWPRCDSRSRRILFLVDGSLTIGEEEFNSNMMDFIINTFCGFSNTENPDAKTEAGVVVFNKLIKSYIDFQEFTPNTFEEAINENVRGQVEISCCTTHAEAALLASTMFADKQDDGFENIAFFITDGLPAANTLRGRFAIDKDPEALRFYQDFGLDVSEWTSRGEGEVQAEEQVYYTTQLLPQQIQKLFDMNVRLFFIGVPSQRGDVINVDLFNGQQTEYCSPGQNNEPSVCDTMSVSPLVSNPPENHAFAVGTWDLQPLVTEALDRICQDWIPPEPPGGRPSLCASSPVGLGVSMTDNCDLVPLADWLSCCPADESLLGTEVEPMCRDMVTSDPNCVDGISARDCSTLGKDDTLAITVTSEVPASQEDCCLDCQIFGDPECVAFDGTEADWVLCDSRQRSNCRHTRKMCESKVDHTGNACLWSEEIAGKLRGNWPDIAVHGSPCTPDFSSSRPSMLVYAAPGYSVSVEMDERGTIYSVLLDIAAGQFELRAGRCVKRSDTDPDGVWGSAGPIPDTFFVKEVISDSPFHEIVWQAGDAATGIILEIVCAQTESRRDGSTDYARINIRNVIETDPARTGTSGFCPTGVIDEQQASPASPVDSVVWSRCTYNERAALCSVLGNPSCTEAEVLEYATNWCERVFGNADQIKECSRDMRRGDTEGMWKHYYCSNLIEIVGGMSLKKCHQRMNRNPEDMIKKYGLVNAAPDRCGSQASDYGLRTESQKCQRGTIVEYFEVDEGEYKEVLFIPDTYLPCGGTLTLNAQDYPKLFTRALRFRQCDVDTSCDMLDQCKPIPASTISIQFDSCAR